MKIDDLTVEFRLTAVNPIFLEHLDTLWIMSKAWCEKNRADKPLDFKNKEESSTPRCTPTAPGPTCSSSRAPGIKTTYRRNPAYWGRIEGNVQEIVFTPIGNDATRLAALVSGEIDFVLDPAPRDVARLRQTPGVKVIDGPENRVVFIGMDQGRDELLYSSVKGKNPFKDVRVRKALYQAIDIQTLKTRLMQGQSAPTGAMTPSPAGAYDDPALEARAAVRPRPRREGCSPTAGYPDGFEVQLDCPNNRYVNDEQICIALAGMWAQIKVKVKVVAEPRVDLLPAPREVRLQHVHARLGRRLDRRRADADAGDAQQRGRRRASASTTTAMRGTTSSTRSPRSRASSPIPKKREAMVKAALREFKDSVHDPAAAPPGDPVGGARQRRRRPPRRQLARGRLGHRRPMNPAGQAGRPHSLAGYAALWCTCRPSLGYFRSSRLTLAVAPPEPAALRPRAKRHFGGAAAGDGSGIGKMLAIRQPAAVFTRVWFIRNGVSGAG